MAQADGKTAIADWNARNLEQKFNGELNYTADPLLALAPKYKVYIFNVGPVRHEVPKGSAGTYIVPACARGENYSEPLILPSIVSDSYFVETEMKTHSVTGEFMAQDIVHPIVGKMWSFGQNLDDFGVFWTRNEVPTEEEVNEARGKLDKTFRKLLEHATMLETTNRLQDITPLMRLAADFYGEDRGWNKIYKKLAECYACGESVKPGVIMHTCGAIQPGMWPAAVRAGLKTKAQAAEAGVELETQTSPSGRRASRST